MEVEEGRKSHSVALSEAAQLKEQECVDILISLSMGVGMFNSFNQVGFVVGLVCIILLGLVASASTYFICCLIHRSKHRKYGDMITKSFGTSVSKAEIFFRTILLLGICAVYKIVFAELSTNIIAQLQPSIQKSNVWLYSIIACTIINLVFTSVNSQGVYTRLSKSNNIVIILGILVVIGCYLIGYDNTPSIFIFTEDKYQRLQWVNMDADLNSYAKTISSLIFTYMNHVGLFPVFMKEGNAQPSLQFMNRVNQKSSIILIAIYTVFTVLGYLFEIGNESFGQSCLLIFKGPVSIIISGLLMRFLLAQGSYHCFLSVNSLEQLVQTKIKGLERVFLSVGMQLLLLLMCVQNRSLISYINIIGSSAGVMIMIIFPIICYISELGFGYLRVIYAVFCIVIGIVVFYATLFISPVN